MKETVIVLRGTSSSGKTTFAEFLQKLNPNSVVCTADDYFYKDGKYNFDASKLGAAHQECKNKFAAALAQKTPLIIVANTNTTVKEFSFYIDAAKKSEYRVFSLVVEKRHEGVNSHNCPLTTIFRQADNIEESLKLH